MGVLVSFACALSLISVAVAIYALVCVKSRLKVHVNSKGIEECSSCQKLVARYFINADGGSTCANCNPEAFEKYHAHNANQANR